MQPTLAPNKEKAEARFASGASLLQRALKTKFQVTIPAEIAKQLQLSVGDFLEATADRGRLVLTPKMIVDRTPAKVSPKNK